MKGQSLSSALETVASALAQERRGEALNVRSTMEAVDTLKAWRMISGVSEVIFFLAWLLPPLLLVLVLEWSALEEGLLALVAGVSGMAMIPWAFLVRMPIDAILENAGASRQQIAEANSLLRVVSLYLDDKMQ